MFLRRFGRAAVGGAIGLAVAAAPWAGLAGQSLPASQPSPKQDQKPPRPAPTPGFRARTNSALSAPFPASPAERKAQAEALLAFYKEIGEAKEIIPAERNRLHARLKSRLARLADAIATDVKRARTAGQTGNRSSTAGQPADNRSSTGGEAASTSQAAPANGGAPQDDGQALVELIQATIAPQSWDVNGGAGTIVYWPAWHALVVRQTDDVHEQIGGVVHGMRK